MASCERCWRQAGVAAATRCVDQADEYARLVRVNDCTPEQQAGEYAGMCPKCDTKTVHQHTHQCIACGWEKETP